MKLCSALDISINLKDPKVRVWPEQLPVLVWRSVLWRMGQAADLSIWNLSGYLARNDSILLTSKFMQLFPDIASFRRLVAEVLATVFHLWLRILAYWTGFRNLHVKGYLSAPSLEGSLLTYKALKIRFEPLVNIGRPIYYVRVEPLYCVAEELQENREVITGVYLVKHNSRLVVKCVVTSYYQPWREQLHSRNGYQLQSCHSLFGEKQLTVWKKDIGADSNVSDCSITGFGGVT